MFFIIYTIKLIYLHITLSIHFSGMARYHFFLAAAAIEEKQDRKLQRRAIRDACNPFDKPDEELWRIYRVRKELALYVC